MRVKCCQIKHQVLGCLVVSLTVFGCVSHQKTGSDISHVSLTGQERADFAYTQGEAYSQDGKPKIAIEYFKEALIHDGSSQSLKVRLATELVRVGAIRESIALVDEVLAQDPSYVKALMLKGSLLGALKNTSEAIETFEALLKIDPDYTDAITSLGAIYAEEQKYDLAQQQFFKLTQMKSYPNPEAAYYYLGRILEEKGDAKSRNEALSAYSKALELKPSYVDALMSAVAIHLQQKNSAKAQSLLESWQAQEGFNLRVSETLANLYIVSNQLDKALAQMRLIEGVSPQSHDVKLRMAVILMGKEQYAESAILLETILKEAPDSDRVRFSLGVVYAEMKEWDKAVVHLSQVPYYSSHYVDSVIQSVEILRTQNRVSQATKLVSEAMQKKEDVTDFYILYATLLDDQKKYQENATFLGLAKEKFPESITLLFLYAMSFERVNDKDLAVQWMRNVLQKEPNHALALNYIAYSYAEQSLELDEALKLAQRALKQDPENPFIQDTLGWIYHQKGQYKQALVWLEKAFNGSNNESIIMDHLGDTYLKLGLLEKAQVMYDLAYESSDEVMFREQVKTKRQALRIPDSKVQAKDRLPATSIGP